MHRLMAVGLLAGCLCSWSASAQGAAKEMTPEQKKQARAELLAKYDANKDGKVDESEQAKMTKEDKAKWAESQEQKKEKTEGTTQ